MVFNSIITCTLALEVNEAEETDGVQTTVLRNEGRWVRRRKWKWGNGGT